MTTSQLMLGAAAAALAQMAALPSPAPAQAHAPDRRHLASVSVEALQHTYLECDRAATHTLLDLGSAAHCSMVGEELKHRVFGGDFERLIAWWREHKTVGVEAAGSLSSSTRESGWRAP